jgi:hypothetical protein
MHCDTVGGTKFSADYPFYIQETLRSAYGHNFISAFGAGTCGDINHINVNNPNPFKGLPMAELLGTTLGRTILNASNNLRTVSQMIGASRALTVFALAGPETWVGPTAQSCFDALFEVRRQLQVQQQSLGDTARLFERRADELEQRAVLVRVS